MEKELSKFEKLLRKLDNYVNSIINLERYLKYINVERYTGYIVSYPKTILFSIALITFLLSLGLPKLELDNSVDVIMPKDDAEYLYYKKIEEIYGNIGKFVLIDVTNDKGIWNKKFFIEMDKLVSDIEEYKDFNEERENNRLERFNKLLTIDEIRYEDILNRFKDDSTFQRVISRKKNKIFRDRAVLSKNNIKALAKEITDTSRIKKNRRIKNILSPLTFQDIRGEDDSLVAHDLVKKDNTGKRILPDTPKEYEKLKNDLLKNPFLNKYLYVQNPETGAITDFGIVILTDTESNLEEMGREFIEITDNYQDIKVIPNGGPIINNYMNDNIRNDFEVLLPPMFIIMIFVYFFNFRSIRGVVIPITVLVIADIWLLGLMGHLGYKLTMMGVALPSLLMAIGSSYSIHLLNQYYVDFDLIKEKGKKKGIGISVSHISITISLAGFTTFVGFLTLTTSQVTAIKEWAIFSGIGAMITVILTAVMIPAIFMLLPHKMPRMLTNRDKTIKITLVDKVITRLTKVSTNYSKPFLAFIIITLILSIIGITKIEVETAPYKFFSEDSPILKNVEEVGDKFGGISGFNILINSGEVNGVLKSGFLKKVEKLREWLSSDENKRLNIGNTNTFSDFIKKMHMAMNGDDLKYYRIPDTDADILDYMELNMAEDSNSDGRVDDFEPYIDVDFQTIQVLARLYGKEGNNQAMGTKLMDRIENDINIYLKKEFPEYKTKITGEPVILSRLSDYIVTGQVLSLLLCLTIVSLIVILLFKNYYAGLVALIPMGFAIITNFGIMGWFGIDLDMGTAMIASIAIGIGVDDTIHFLNTFRFYRDKGYGIDEIIENVLKRSGKAIIYTSFALVFGFSVLVLSNFVPNRYFGLLVALSMINTTLGALIILPSTIKATGINLRESESESVIWKYFYIGKIFGLVDED